MPITYRTAGAWGAGKGSDLAPAEVDGNFAEVLQRIVALERGEAYGGPVVIDEIVLGPTDFEVVLSDATVLGPYPLVFAVFAWRGEWQPATAYAALDLVWRPGDALYAVAAEHVSADVFDPAAVLDGASVYERMLAIPAAELTASGTVAASSHTLGQADRRRFTLYTAGAGCDVTVPGESGPGAVTWPVGEETALRQNGAGAVRLIEADGVQISPVEGKLRETAFRGAVMHLKKVAADRWDIWGDLAIGELPTETEPSEPTEAPTEAPSEPPTEPVTEPPTEIPTEAPTEPATEPPTEPATEPATGTEDPFWICGYHIGENASSEATHTLADVGFCAAHADRTIVAVINWARITATGGRYVTGVTIGGVTARRAARATSNAVLVNTEVWWAPVPSGTEGDIVITLDSASPLRWVVGVYAHDGLRREPSWCVGASGSSEAGDDVARTLPVPAGGRAAAGAANAASNAVPPDVGLSGITVDIAEQVVGADSSRRLKGSVAGHVGSATLGLTTTASRLAGAAWRTSPEPHPYFRAHAISSTTATGTSTTTLATGVPLGAADPGRLIVVVYGCGSTSGSGNVASMTITPNAGDPVTLTKVAQAIEGNTARNVEIWCGVVPDGTICSIGIAHNGGVRTSHRHSLTVYAIPDAPMTSPLVTDSDTDVSGIGSATEVGLEAGDVVYIVGGTLGPLGSVGTTDDLTVNLAGVDTIDRANHQIPETLGNRLMAIAGSGAGTAAPQSFTANTETLALAAFLAPVDPPELTEEPSEPLTGGTGLYGVEVVDYAQGEFLGSPWEMGIALGPADADRMIAVVIGRTTLASHAGFAVEIASVSLTPASESPIAMTRAVRSTSGGTSLGCVEIWYAHVPAGTTGQLAITPTPAANNTSMVAVTVYSLIGLEGTYAPIATTSVLEHGSPTADVTVNEADAFVLAGFYGRAAFATLATVDIDGVDPAGPSRNVSAFGHPRLHGRAGHGPTTGSAQVLDSTVTIDWSSTQTPFAVGYQHHIAAVVWPLPAVPGFRITEAGDQRISEAGAARILE